MCRFDRSDERGQTVPLAVAMMTVACAGLIALVPVGRALHQRAQARTAADAAALAGAAEGAEAAAALAAGNGGELVEFERLGDEVVVTVRVDGVDAAARARSRTRGPVSAGGTTSATGGDRAGLAPAMLAALARADGFLGHPVPVVSGLRTRAEQEALWEQRATNPYPVAPPGTSDHERGQAVDVARASVPGLLAVAGEAGLCRPLPDTDPVHFVLCAG